MTETRLHRTPGSAIPGRTLAIWLTFLSSAACGLYSAPEAAAPSTPRPASVSPDGAPNGASGPESIPSFRQEIVPVFERNCASTAGCHGEKPTESVKLDLRPPKSYAQLVKIVAEARPSALRVKPGDDGASFLVAKLTGKLVGQEGKSMPIDPETGAPVVPSPLSSDFIDGILRPWIRAGAPDN